MNVLKVATCTLELPCGEPGQIITIEAKLPPGFAVLGPGTRLRDEHEDWMKHAVTIKVPVADAKWSPRNYVIDPGDFEVFMYSRRSLTEPYRWVALRVRGEGRRDEW